MAGDPTNAVRTEQPAHRRVASVGRPSVTRAGARSALGVLRGLAGLLEPVLLALLHPGVPGEEAGLLQRGPALRVDEHQRPGDAQLQGAGLAGDAAAGDPG